MRLGEILLRRGLVTDADIEAALALQRSEGGRLGDNLIALGRLTAEQLAASSMPRRRCRRISSRLGSRPAICSTCC